MQYNCTSLPVHCTTRIADIECDTKQYKNTFANQMPLQIQYMREHEIK